MMMTVMISGSVKMRLNKLTVPSDRENVDSERDLREMDNDDDDYYDNVVDDDDNDDDVDSRSIKKASGSSQLMGDSLRL